MPYRRLLTAFAFVCVLAVALTARAVVLVNDTWIDDTDSDPASPAFSEFGVDGDLDGDIESAWFRGNVGTFDPVPGAPAGPLRGDLTGTGTSSASWTTYFTPEATPATLTAAGDALQVKWVFKMSGIANDPANNGQAFKLAVVNSPSASRVTTNASPAAPGTGTNYLGYAMFMNIDQTLRRTTPFELRERNAGVAGFLSASADWTAVGDDGTTNDPGYVNGTSYTYTMTLTRTATDGLDIVSRIEGAGLGPAGQGFLQVSFSDPDPSSFSYDMFGLRPSQEVQTASIFDTSLFRVELLPVGGGSENANFDGIGVTDGSDFLIWQRNNGATGTGTLATGDANNNQNVDGVDLGIWRNKFATSVAAAAAVPEPSSLVCGLLAVLGSASFRRRE
jgi:hypothetical protein